MRSTHRGFTLMEVLIALVLLSFMMSILFSGLRLAAGSWDAAQHRVENATEGALAARLVQRQLAMAMHVELFEEPRGEPRLAFRGDPDRVRFVSPLPNHVGGGGLHWITLQLGSTEQGDGLLLSHRIFHPDTFIDLRHEDADAHLLLPGITDLRLRYFGQRRDEPGAGWFDEWREDRLPHLVAMEWTPAEGGPPRVLALGLRQRAPDAVRFIWPWEVR